MTEQQRYQVRFDLGAAGAEAIGADADVLVWVDANGTSEPAMPGTGAVVTASMTDALAVAAWIVALQHDLGTRIAIAIVAAGDHRADGSPRYAVEDHIAAGAIIDELARLGLDATSPEAAAAEAAYRGLAKAVAHLMTASVSAVANPPEKAALRPDPALTAADVVVRRPHPRRP